MTTQEQRFAGRTVLVTGGATGIGLSTALHFAQAGARVVVLGHTAARNAAALDTLRDGGADRPLAIDCDVGDHHAVQRAVAQVLDTTGRLDVVVNNAAVMPHIALADLTPADWHRTLAVNLIGPAVLAAHALRTMSPGGAVVNVASVHAYRAQANAAAYAASKAALVALTRAFAVEGAPRGLRANAVVPGAIDTGMLWANPAVRSGTEAIGTSDIGAPADVAAAIVFLASDAAAFINGSVLAIDGGRLARL